MSSSPAAALSPSGYTDTFARDHLPPADQWPTLEFTTPELQYPERLNAAVELLDATIAEHGADRPALRTPDGTVWSYGELLQRVNQVAAVLTEDLGLVPGNRVLLRSPNNPWTVAAWLGTLKAGGVVVTTMAALRARELGPIVEKTKPSVALVDHRFVEDVETSATPWRPPRCHALRRRRRRRPRPSLRHEVRRRCAFDYTAVDTAADDVALFGPTSGSTGVPKITTHFHRDVLSIDNTFGRHTLRLTEDDVVACTAPFAFTFGLGMLVVFTLRAGACALVTETATPAQLAELVEEHGVTVLATAPTAYKQIMKAGHLPRLRGCASRSAPASTSRRRSGRRSAPSSGSRSSTASAPPRCCTSSSRPRATTSARGSTGKPVPGYRATILGPDDQPVPVGTEGRLAVIGPVGCRYLDDDRQHAYVVDGWNVTGDTFVQDEDGYFFYRARTDSMIVSSGYNIGAPEVEAAIDGHPDVVEAGVVGEPDPERGSVVSAFVVLREGVVGDEAKAKEIQDHVKATAGAVQVPPPVRFVDQLPRNTSGKLQHFKLRDLTQPAPPDRSAPRRRRHEDRDRRRGPGRALPRCPDEAARRGPRGDRLGAQRPGRHVRVRGGVLRRDARRDRERRHDDLPGDGEPVRAVDRHRRGHRRPVLDHRRPGFRGDEPQGAAAHPAGPRGRAGRRRPLPDRRPRHRRAARHLRPRRRRRRPQLPGAGTLRRRVRPEPRPRHNKYIWFGTDLVFEAFQFIVRNTEFGTMQIHGYPYSDEGSTFIVEMHEDVWRRAGFDRTEDEVFPPGVSDEYAVQRVAEIFADDLGGHRILTNNSKWLSFTTVRNASWHDDNVVLLGDAAHTAHFSIGSGTKLAMEDALALAACLHEHGSVPKALAAYQEERKPVVESTQRAAQASLEWFENIGMYADQDPDEFVFNLLTRRAGSPSRTSRTATRSSPPASRAPTPDRWPTRRRVPSPTSSRQRCSSPHGSAPSS